MYAIRSYYEINAEQKAKAHSELARWLDGDHAPNNTAYVRHEAI